MKCLRCERREVEERVRWSVMHGASEWVLVDLQLCRECMEMTIKTLELLRADVRKR